MKLIEKMNARMKVEDFQSTFPSVRLTGANEADYDAEFWEMKIRHCRFAQFEESIEELDFNVSIAFEKEQLSFLQYFGRSAADAEGYEKSGRAYFFLRNQIVRMLGKPGSESLYPDFQTYKGHPRYDYGPPDERIIEIADCSWPGRAYLESHGDSEGRIAIEFRLEE